MKNNEPCKIIMGAGKYNIFNTLNELKKNRPLIESYLKGDVVEGFHMTKDSSSDGMMGMGIGLFLTVVVMAIGLWVWALVVTVKYFNVLPVWAQILAVLGLLGFGGPIMTLIVVYIGKGMDKGMSSGMSHRKSW